MPAVRCFLIEPTDRVRRWLRRYVDIPHSGWTCADGWHNAMVQIEDGPALPYKPDDPDYEGCVTTDPMDWSRSDPRWPVECERGCGYHFADRDRWQLFYEPIYRVIGGDQEVLARPDLDESSVGAMWFAKWCPRDWWGPEGKGCLCVNTPGGMWPIDGPAHSPDGTSTPHAWTRTGIPPHVTARPSILIGNRYHGFLTDGVLTEC